MSIDEPISEQDAGIEQAVAVPRDLTGEEIIAAIAARAKHTWPFDVPEWGGRTYIRRLDTDDLTEAGYLNPDVPPLRLMINFITVALANKNGDRLFTKAQVKALVKSDLEVAEPVFDEIIRLNKIGPQSVSEAADSFDEAQDEDSSTD